MPGTPFSPIDQHFHVACGARSQSTIKDLSTVVLGELVVNVRHYNTSSPTGKGAVSVGGGGGRSETL